MKKIQRVSLFVVFISTLLASQVEAANPLLVASIRDDAVLTLVDVELDVFFEDDSPDQAESKKIQVYGVLERLDPTNINATATVTTVDQISSQQDLETFTKAVVRDNDTVSLVVVESDSVSVTRMVPAKLFWLFNIRGKETAEVISWGDGTSAVMVTRPWWGRFSDYGTNELEVSNSLFKKIRSLPPSVLTTELSANTKARIISEITETFNENNGDAKIK